MPEAAVGALCEELFAGLPRSDQRRKAELYVRGLLSAGGRKSIRNIAARVGDRAAEQSPHHFISSSTWDRNLVRGDRLADPVVFQVREPARPEEVYVGACGPGVYGDRPQPSFDPAVPGGWKGAATREVADADEHAAWNGRRRPSHSMLSSRATLRGLVMSVSVWITGPGRKGRAGVGPACQASCPSSCTAGAALVLGWTSFGTKTA